MPDDAELGCEDCPAIVRHRQDRGLLGSVLVVAVEHEPTCPWLTRVAPIGVTMASPRGILVHGFREPAEGGGATT